MICTTSITFTRFFQSQTLVIRSWEFIFYQPPTLWLNKYQNIDSRCCRRKWADIMAKQYHCYIKGWQLYLCVCVCVWCMVISSLLTAFLSLPFSTLLYCSIKLVNLVIGYCLSPLLCLCGIDLIIEHQIMSGSRQFEVLVDKVCSLRLQITIEITV